MKKFFITIFVLFLLAIAIVVYAVIADKERQKPINMTVDEIEQAVRTVRAADGRVVDVSITNKTLIITHKFFDTDDGRKLNNIGRKMMRTSDAKTARKWCNTFPEIQTVVINNTKGFQKAKISCK